MNAIIKKTCNVLGWVSLVISIFLVVLGMDDEGILLGTNMFNAATSFGVFAIVFFMKSK